MTKKHEPGMAYDMKKLNKVFAFLSVAFLLTVLWVFLDDYMRPWKMVQLEAQKIKRDKLTAKIEAEAKKIDQKKLEELNKKLSEGEKIVANRKDEIKKAQKKSLIQAFKNKRLPYREFIVKEFSEEVLGELFSIFILETIIIGNLLNLNPYNQPAVEQVKISTKKLLS